MNRQLRVVCCKRLHVSTERPFVFSTECRSGVVGYRVATIRRTRRVASRDPDLLGLREVPRSANIINQDRLCGRPRYHGSAFRHAAARVGP
jgi:hypothetical protein